MLQVLERLCEANTKEPWTMYHWDITGSIESNNPNAPLPQNGEEADQLSILNWFDSINDGMDDGTSESYTIMVLKDFNKFLGDGQNSDQLEKQVIRKLRNMCQKYKYKRKCIIILGITLNMPVELQKLSTIVDWPLPEREHITELVGKMLTDVKSRDDLKRFQTDYEDEDIEEIVSSLQGLSLNEIELLNSYVVLTQDRLSPMFMASRKRQIIRESGVLDWRDVQLDIDNVGGVPEFKKWFERRKGAFGQEAHDYGLPGVKGVLAVGVQGCGKSLLAEALAQYYGLPLLRLDIGSLFTSELGGTEEKMRRAIKVAESVAPCILWIDELEKSLSGSGSSSYTDGGTASRVFASFLTWMQMKTKPVFLFATANDISAMPPEMIRKGRFDEIFFVDLPSKVERSEIFKIHLAKRGRDSSKFDIAALVEESDGFTGAEIEAAIVDALYAGFSEQKREINTQDIIVSLSETVPLSVQMKEQVSKLREWARTRARHASVPRQSAIIRSEIAKIKEAPRNTVVAVNYEPEEDEEL